MLKVRLRKTTLFLSGDAQPPWVLNDGLRYLTGNHSPLARNGVHDMSQHVFLRGRRYDVATCTSE